MELYLSEVLKAGNKLNQREPKVHFQSTQFLALNQLSSQILPFQHRWRFDEQNVLAMFHDYYEENFYFSFKHKHAHKIIAKISKIN